MEKITSVNNPIIKELKKQKLKGLLFLDNPKLIEEAINAGFNPLYTLIQDGKNFDFLKNYNPIIVSKQIIDIFSDVKTNQGVIVVIDIPKKSIEKPKGNYLVLDNVQDAGNVGTLIRSALGAKFHYIYLLECAKLSNIKTVRSSMGACFNTHIYECKKHDFIYEFKNWNLDLFYCDMNGINIYEKEFKNHTVGIVVGNEGKGVSEEIKNLASESIKLPMDSKLESLNAGVSGSIIMYQITYGGSYVRS